MLHRKLSPLFVALAALFFAFPTAANAAFITIDDSDPNTITITAGDFEEGFFVDGNLFTIGLGNSATQTFADGGHSISGSWIDLGVTPPGYRVDVLFALSSDPTAVTSGIEFGVATDGFLATLFGSFGGFTGDTYFTTALPTFPQDGSTQPFEAPFLSGSFTSEAVAQVIPEPATLALFGLFAVGGLGYRRWRGQFVPS